MKKKLLYVLFTVAILISAGYGFYRSMNSHINLSDMTLNNVLALANIENPDPGENGDFNCSLTKDYCTFRVTAELIPVLKEKFNIDVSIGITIDLTDFTKVYAAAVPNKPRVRCGIDVLCNDLLSF